MEKLFGLFPDGDFALLPAPHCPMLVYPAIVEIKQAGQDLWHAKLIDEQYFKQTVIGDSLGRKTHARSGERPDTNFQQ
jgi:hypothetical protein